MPIVGRSTGARARLKLLSAPLPPPLPTATELFPCTPRRPGDLHEPLHLTTDVRERAAVEARRRDLPLALTVTLLVEGGLVTDELEAVGLDHSVLAGHPESPPRRMSAGEADYVRALTMRPPGFQAADGPVSIPVRLHARLRGYDPASLLHVSLDQSVAWELAAIRAGRTMSEWALAVALRHLS